VRPPLAGERRWPLRPAAAASPPCTRRSPTLSRPRCLQLTLALTTYSINRGKVGICRSQRLPRLLAGREAAGRAPGSVRLPSLLLPVPPPLPPPLLPCGCRKPRGRDCPRAWPQRNHQSLPLACSRGLGAGGQAGSQGAGLWVRRGRPAGSHTKAAGSLVPLLAVLTPQIKGLRTMTSTLLSRRFSFWL